ncbi:hypothetical protein WHX56_24690 [Achromobacter veterisilvae]|uniref:Uncharacterized protein n=1 Tax=Achromobacter veterisilvae TaxID=2069367 RepID=A0ABZ2RXM2_9BURK
MGVARQAFGKNADAERAQPIGRRKPAFALARKTGGWRRLMAVILDV